ncbi:retron-type reverse transcriptase [Clostridiales Family XIII bacterium PM5-7]
MTYIITKQTKRTETMSFEDVLFGLIDEDSIGKYRKTNVKINSTKTIVAKDTSKVLTGMKKEYVVSDMVRQLEKFYDMHKNLDISFDDDYCYADQVKAQRDAKFSCGLSDEEEVNEKTKEILESTGKKYNPNYYTFFLPKRSGSGLRQIDAPHPELKAALTELKLMLEEFMKGNTYHTAAYAYIPGRCTQDLVRKLQKNKSRWILKLDFSNFFGSIDIDFTMRQMKQIFPFSEICSMYGGERALYNCLRLCFLDGRLPQGTPISPLLTNILMIPIDFKIYNKLLTDAKSVTEFDKDDGEQNFKLLYTRYADDLFIGGHRGFKYSSVIEYINSVLEEEQAPFKLNTKKTRYGSIAGSNWILGLMYNQDYGITIGHKEKKRIQAMITNFMMDVQNGNFWDVKDIQVMMGNISYLKSVEPKSCEQIIEKYNKKFNANVLDTMKECLNVNIN